MSKYTIKDITATGKTDPTYGAEYIVHFSEDTREVRLSRKNLPQVGDEQNGTIISGQYGAYFKKDPLVAAAATNSTVADPDAKPVYKDNSDGMRQGMCFNNAANHVNATAPTDISASVWANMVHTYAKALYLIGGLTDDEELSLELPKETKETFGGNRPDNQSA